MKRASRLLPDIRKGLERFATVNIVLTRHAGHAVDLVAAADLDTFDGVIAAGGDGTLYEVLNGLYRKPVQDRVPLGLVPVGTGKCQRISIACTVTWNFFAPDQSLAPAIAPNL